MTGDKADLDVGYQCSVDREREWSAWGMGGGLRWGGGMGTAMSSTEQRSSASGQYPAAAVLACVDSRVPAEIVFDVGIGDTFNAVLPATCRMTTFSGAWFACAVAVANVVLVPGHTACGAIEGAIDDVVLGNLTVLLARIEPAIPATKFEGDKSSKNPAYVDAGAKRNVAQYTWRHS